MASVVGVALDPRDEAGARGDDRVWSCGLRAEVLARLEEMAQCGGLLERYRFIFVLARKSG